MENKETDIKIGESFYTLNIKYNDGTLLRKNPTDDKIFNDVVVLNDVPVKILDVSNNYALIEKPNGEKGWIRIRNLTKIRREHGLDKHLVANEVVTPDKDYVRGMKLHGVGIKQDLCQTKLGKGDFHLISPIWLNDLTEFVTNNKEEIKLFIDNARENPSQAFIYLLNSCHYLFNQSITSGFKDNLDNLKMASFLCLAAAEVDDFPFKKYSSEERKLYTEKLFNTWANIDVNVKPMKKSMKFNVPEVNYDLLPYVAMDRFGLNNSLSSLKYDDPLQELREGFKLSKRVDSCIRHFNSVHANMKDEDHIIHALWNLHAIYHNLVLFPEKNDIAKYNINRFKEVKRYVPSSSLDEIDKNLNHVSDSDVLKYDWNEGAISPPDEVFNALIDYLNTPRLQWYPHLEGGEKLKSKILKYALKDSNDELKSKVDQSNLIITNGSDDALIMICQRFLGVGKCVLIPTPTYEHFLINAEATGCKVVKYNPSDCFKNNLQELIKEIDFNSPDVVYLISPNNPTGTIWLPEEVKTLLVKFPKVLFIVDEAYYEFGDGSSCFELSIQFENLIVTRTASKAFCLAAVRCGYILGHASSIKKLYPLYNPKSVNEFAQIAFSVAIDCYDSFYKEYISTINYNRKKFISDLNSNGIEVKSGGYGNFVCVKLPSKFEPKEFVNKLKESSIYVRDISGRFPGFIRITIGIKMEKVVDKMKEIILSK